MGDRRTIVCEGRDDLAALRAMLRKRAAEPVKGESTAERLRVKFTLRELMIEVVIAQGKAEIPTRVRDALEGTVGERPTRIGICFDPDLDPPDGEHRFLGSIPPPGGADVPILPAGWRPADPVVFSSADPAEHCLERVLIGGILGSPAASRFADWVGASLSSLLELVPGHGWKRAFRIWGAALAPNVESLVDRLMQDSGTKEACLAALERTPVARMLDEILA